MPGLALEYGLVDTFGLQDRRECERPFLSDLRMLRIDLLGDFGIGNGFRRFNDM